MAQHIVWRATVARAADWPLYGGVLDALYNQEILRLAADIPHLGELADAQGRARRVSAICGSRVDAALRLDAAGRVAQFAQLVRACALGQASAAILGAGVIGRTAGELAQARDELAAFLGSADAPPPRLFPRAAIFAPARTHRARHASIRLAFEAAAQAAAEAEAMAARAAAGGEATAAQPTAPAATGGEATAAQPTAGAEQRQPAAAGAP